MKKTVQSQRIDYTADEWKIEDGGGFYFSHKVQVFSHKPKVFLKTGGHDKPTEFTAEAARCVGAALIAAADVADGQDMPKDGPWAQFPRTPATTDEE